MNLLKGAKVTQMPNLTESQMLLKPFSLHNATRHTMGQESEIWSKTSKDCPNPIIYPKELKSWKWEKQILKKSVSHPEKTTWQNQNESKREGFFQWLLFLEKDF